MRAYYVVYRTLVARACTSRYGGDDNGDAHGDDNGDAHGDDNVDGSGDDSGDANGAFVHITLFLLFL